MFTDSKKNTAKRSLFHRQFLWICFTVVALLCLPSTSRANGEFTPQELDTLVSTIALYPDPLLVQVLAASIHGDEIPGASDWASQHKELKGQALADAMENEDLPYDESVQALIPFPTVLATMAKYQVWTDQLGDAVASQKEDVMDAVQRMRNAAYKHGHLQSNEQVKVIKEKTIVIEPVQKEYIYVPVYNPHVVYYVYSNGYPGLRYRTGVWLGSDYQYWGWGSSWFEWDTHLIYIHDYRWYHHRPIPRRYPRYHHAPPPRNDRYEMPRGKVPMNHRNTPNASMSRQQSNSSQYLRNSSNVTTFRKINNSNEDYYNQNQKQQSYGKVTTTHSSERTYNSNRSSSTRSNSSRGGFGKSLRK